MTNKEFAKKDEVFMKACELASTQPTGRQASKFRRNKGIAFLHKKEAIIYVAKEREND